MNGLEGDGKIFTPHPFRSVLPTTFGMTHETGPSPIQTRRPHTKCLLYFLYDGQEVFEF